MQESILKKWATNGTVFREGNNYFRKGIVKGINTSRQLEQIDIVAYVQEEKTHKVAISTNVQGDKIISFKCTCPNSKAYPGICKHGIATLMGYSERGEKEEDLEKVYRSNKYSSQNVVLESLFEQYKNIAQSNYQTEKQESYSEVSLIPEFSFSKSGQIYMKLSIAQDKSYPVENIYKLSQDIRENRIKTYGKNNIMRVGVEFFERNSRALAEWVSTLMSIDEKIVAMSEAILLDREAVRNVFEILKKNKWEGDHPFTKEKQCIEWTNEPLEIQFVVDENIVDFTLKMKNIKVEELISFFEGEYLLYENVFYQTAPSFREKVWPLIKSIMNEKTHQIIFNKEEMAKVSRMILPYIHEQIELNLSEEAINAYMPPDLEAKVYLDLPDKSSLTAKVIYQYGEELFNPANEESVAESIRDEYKEYTIEKMLWKYGFNKGINGLYILEQEGWIYKFIKEAIEPMGSFSEIYISDKLKQARIRQIKSVSVGIRLEGDWLGIDLSCIGIPKEELGRVLLAYQAKKKYFRLKNGEFVDLTGEGMEQLEGVVEGLNLTEQEVAKQELLIPKYRALYLEKLLKEDKHIKTAKDEKFKELIQDFEEIEEVQVEMPEGLKNVLRDYQCIGYKWLKTLGNYGFGGILADDMGLGKTLQMIAVLSSEQNQAPSLIVCPTSLVFNWESEFQKFAQYMKVLLVQGSQAQREEKIKYINEYDIVVTSYDSLKRDLEQYKEYTFNYCIIDEAQYIKNNHTQNAKAVKEIKSQKRMALTGTPIENSLSELWSIFDFVMPGYLLGEGQFRKKIESPIIRDQDEEVMERLRKMIAPFILRRLKKEVIEELPEKIETVVYSELAEEQYKVYMAYVAKAREEVMEQIAVEGMEKSHIKMLACLTRLRQICCHPALFLENYEGESAKLETCLELIRNTTESGHKVLLFSQFTSMLEVIAKGLMGEGISYSLLKGDVKAEKRRELVESFNTGDTKVFLISLKAGGVGLNLTSADVVIHYDPWWNASAENQATDRAYRIGQMNNVQVFKLITKGTIEEKIKAMQDKKQNLTENILNTESTFINKLSKEDILSLFSIE